MEEIPGTWRTMRPLQKNPLRAPAPTGAWGPIQIFKTLLIQLFAPSCLTLMASAASLCPIPLVDLPLIERTLSPLLARPSKEAGEEGRTRWT